VFSETHRHEKRAGVPRETKDSENYPPRLMKKMITTTSRRAAKKSPSIESIAKKISKRPGGFRRGVSTKD
jgi:hypothetical protein